MKNVLGWVKKNLLSSPTDVLLSLTAMAFLYYFIWPATQWIFLKSTFGGGTPDQCSDSGACWVFIHDRFAQFMYGFYPKLERWRIDLAYGVGFGILAGLFIFPKGRFFYKLSLILLGCFPVLAYILFVGDCFGLPYVDSSLWGGLHVTLVVAMTGIVISFPMGIILALGRASDLILIKAICVAFIELWRGVPLISVLFMSSVMLPLFLPDGLEINKLFRALIGVSLFASAYMAEVIRGGLQAIPKGQTDAANALGLSYWQTQRFVILPQGIRIVIPGIVNTFIGLFKDTTLVLIIGIFDLLGMVQAANTDPKWLAYTIEGYLFAAFVFWIFCFGMSRYSQSLERK